MTRQLNCQTSDLLDHWAESPWLWCLLQGACESHAKFRCNISHSCWVSETNVLVLHACLKGSFAFTSCAHIWNILMNILNVYIEWIYWMWIYWMPIFAEFWVSEYSWYDASSQWIVKVMLLIRWTVDYLWPRKTSASVSCVSKRSSWMCRGILRRWRCQQHQGFLCASSCILVAPFRLKLYAMNLTNIFMQWHTSSECMDSLHSSSGPRPLSFSFGLITMYFLRNERWTSGFTFLPKQKLNELWCCRLWQQGCPCWRSSGANCREHSRCVPVSLLCACTWPWPAPTYLVCIEYFIRSMYTSQCHMFNLDHSLKWYLVVLC